MTKNPLVHIRRGKTGVSYCGHRPAVMALHEDYRKRKICQKCWTRIARKKTVEDLYSHCAHVDSWITEHPKGSS